MRTLHNLYLIIQNVNPIKCPDCLAVSNVSLLEKMNPDFFLVVHQPNKNSVNYKIVTTVTKIWFQQTVYTSNTPHQTCRLPTYRPKLGATSPIRRVGCQHTALSWDHRLPTYNPKLGPHKPHKTCRLPTYSPKLVQQAPSWSNKPHKTCRLPTYSPKLGP